MVSGPWIATSTWSVRYYVTTKEGDPPKAPEPAGPTYVCSVVGPCAPGVPLCDVPGMPGWLAPAFDPNDPAAEAAWRLSDGAALARAIAVEPVELQVAATPQTYQQPITWGDFALTIGDCTLTGGSSVTYAATGSFTSASAAQQIGNSLKAAFSAELGKCK